MRLIPNWQNYSLHCCVCGTDKSVKYFVDLNIKDRIGTVCMCNACAARRLSNND